jgi:hypothetical protein
VSTQRYKDVIDAIAMCNEAAELARKDLAQRVLDRLLPIPAHQDVRDLCQAILKGEDT